MREVSTKQAARLIAAEGHDETHKVWLELRDDPPPRSARGWYEDVETVE